MTAVLVSVFVWRSKVFGVDAVPGDYFPAGFAGEVASPGLPRAERQRVLDYRPDGTPVLTPDKIRFTDAIAGEIEMPRPAVSLAEAGRLGQDEKWTTPEAVMTYGMRGPVSNGFTETDARWVIETARRHETPEVRGKAITLIAFAVTSREISKNYTYSDETLAEMVRTFESALVSSDPSMRRAALAMCDWAGWAAISDTYLETLSSVVRNGTESDAQRASFALVHTFGVEVEP